MRIMMHNELSFLNDEHGYRFAKEWCERRKRQNIRHKMKETTTTISVEEWYEVTVSDEEVSE